jgi:phosphatidyl-myo-inositol alpha-mannosyltransferase
VKIVLTNPFCWPYVRRGSERNMETVSLYLAHRGHEVITVATHPGRKTVEQHPSGKRILHGPCWTPLLRRAHIEATHTFFFPALRTLRSLNPDVVHSFFFTDAIAAAYTRGSKTYRTILQMNGIGIPGISCRRFPPEAWMYRQAITRSDCRIACSRFIAGLVRDHYGADSHVLTPPVDFAGFPLGNGPADGRPTILSTADFNLPRKGARVLVAAFRLLKDRVPDAVLKLSGSMSDQLRSDLVRNLPDSVRKDVQILGLGKAEDVPALFREASIFALPSMWEPSGGSMLEAWASGTPVVVTNHGGLPEFVTEDVGIVFDPKTNGIETSNAEGLSEALLRGLELSQQQGVRERCRAHAEQYSPVRIGLELERLYGAR